MLYGEWVVVKSEESDEAVETSVTNDAAQHHIKEEVKEATASELPLYGEVIASSTGVVLEEASVETTITVATDTADATGAVDATPSTAMAAALSDAIARGKRLVK